MGRGASLERIARLVHRRGLAVVLSASAKRSGPRGQLRAHGGPGVARCRNNERVVLRSILLGLAVAAAAGFPGSSRAASNANRPSASSGAVRGPRHRPLEARGRRAPRPRRVVARRSRASPSRLTVLWSSAARRTRRGRPAPVLWPRRSHPAVCSTSRSSTARSPSRRWPRLHVRPRTPNSASGTLGTTKIIDLQALGRRITHGSAALGSWGLLTIGRRSAGSGAHAGAKAYSGSVTGLDVSLLRAHDGLPAGSEIEIAVVRAAAVVPPPPAGLLPSGPLPGDRPQLLPPTVGPLLVFRR